MPGEIDDHIQKIKFRPLPKTTYNMNSYQIKNINIRAKAIKKLEENIRGKVHKIRFGKDFLDMTPK